MEEKKTVFQRNLEALKDKSLIQKILNHIISQKLSIGNTNGYNLFYGETPLHSTESPLGEAQAIFKTCKNAPASITIVYGLGLGYLFQYAAQNTNGYVILYEPNFDIIKTTFQLVDFSNELKNNNIFITTNKEELNNVLRNCYSSDCYPETVCLPAYKTLFSEQISKDSTEFNTLIGSVAMDYSYTKHRFFHIATTILNNIPYLVKEPPLCSIKNCYEGKTAVICSAGPTLTENLETLKKYQDNVVIFSVGPAFKPLINAGITPDFLCIIENKDCSGQIKDTDLSKTCLIIEPYTHSKFHKKLGEAKQVFSHISNNLPPNTIWKDIVNIDDTEYVSKGTVSYCALNSARILGCKRMVLVGQDLAFIGEHVYSKDSVYKDLKIRFNKELNKHEVYAENFDRYAENLTQCIKKESKDRFARQRIESYNKKLVSIRGITGELLPTEIVYTTFASHISKYPILHPELEYINTSMKGALIEGFKNIPLEDALKDTSKIEKIDFSDICTFDKDLVSEKLNQIHDSFKEAEDKIAEIKRLLVRFKTENIRHKALTKELLLTLKKVISAYSELSIKYADSNKLFDFITKKEQIEFEDFLKKALTIDYEAAVKLAELQSAYLDATTANIEQIKNIINSNIEILRS